jgi:hypothetical protein
MVWRFLIIDRAKAGKNKSRPKAAVIPFAIDKVVLADRRRLRTRHRDRLARFDDAGGLNISHIGPGRDPNPRDSKASDQRHYHDLQMRRTIGRMN